MRLRTRLAALMALLALLAACGRLLPTDHEQVSPDERIVIKFSHVVAENTPKGIAARRFATLVKQRTGGKVEVQVFPNSQLFRDGEELAALRRNEVQLIAPTFSKLGEVESLWLVMDLPYLFPDREGVERVLTGHTGKVLEASLRRQGLEAVAFWENGFKVITNARGPVVLPQDLKGLKLRIQPSMVTRESFTGAGAEVSIQPFDSVYGVLSSGNLDGQENVPSNITSKRLHELQPYMTVAHHGYLGYAVITNQKFWTGLSPELRAILEEAMAEVTEWVAENAERMNEEAMERIKAGGKVEIHYQTPQEAEQWRAAMEPAYKWAEERMGPDAVLMAVKEAQGQ